MREGRRHNLLIILGETSHHFCFILSVRSESLNPAPTQGEGITQGKRISGSILDPAGHIQVPFPHLSSATRLC